MSTDTESVVTALTDACRRGDVYGGMCVFTAVLRRRDINMRLLLLSQAFHSAAVLLRCAEAAAELSTITLNTLKDTKELPYNNININSDNSNNNNNNNINNNINNNNNVWDCVRRILRGFEEVEENDAAVTPAWCRAHVRFARDLLQYCESTQRSQQQQQGENNNNNNNDNDNNSEEMIYRSVVFVYEALAQACLQLFHCMTRNISTAANSTTSSTTTTDLNKMHSVEEEESEKIIVEAYHTSLHCVLKRDLILSAVSNVESKLTTDEKPFLIARTVYGVLSGVSAVLRTPHVLAVNTAKYLLQLETMSAHHTELVAFLNDVIIVLHAALNMRSRGTSAVSISHVNVIEVLCKVYSPVLGNVQDLNWITLARSF